MDQISREDLKAKLDQGDDFKLVMAMGGWHFMAKRIPGSISVTNFEEGQSKLNVDDEIVVYCSSEQCVASQMAYRILRKNGFTNVWRYSGGIADWEAAGLPLEGELV